MALVVSNNHAPTPTPTPTKQTWFQEISSSGAVSVWGTTVMTQIHRNSRISNNKHTRSIRITRNIWMLKFAKGWVSPRNKAPPTILIKYLNSPRETSKRVTCYATIPPFLLQTLPKYPPNLRLSLNLRTKLCKVWIRGIWSRMEWILLHPLLINRLVVRVKVALLDRSRLCNWIQIWLQVSHYLRQTLQWTTTYHEQGSLKVHRNLHQRVFLLLQDPHRREWIPSTHLRIIDKARIITKIIRCLQIRRNIQLHTQISPLLVPDTKV